MRIVSLLPSATEIVFALGLGDDLHGVTFECDFPPEARTKAVVSGTALPESQPDGSPLSAADIDTAVSASIGSGQPIYRLDAARIGAIDPDLILTQDLCQVCAVPTGAVEDALDVLGCSARVVSLDPASLGDVLACITQVGDATGAAERAQTVTEGLHRRLAAVTSAVAGRPRPRVFPLEWSDPPFSGGHWVPDMIAAAGGEPVLAPAGQPSRRLDWDEIAATPADAVVFMPCGYDLARAVAEGRRSLVGHPALAAASQLFAADANACFSRPGPRLVDGVEALAAVLHPDAGLTPRPDLLTCLSSK
ncbi:MAG: cobalamin-binding protein [Acidimicrobiales bacterium]